MTTVKLDFKPRLRGIARLILSLLANFGTMLVNRIKDAETKLMAQGVMKATTKTIAVLSDADPDDKAQLQAIFNSLIKDGPFRQGSSAELSARIALIEDEDTRVFLSQIVSEAYPVADILTDENPDNSEQTRLYVRQLLRSEGGMILLRSFFGIILPPEYANTAGLVIIQLLLSVLEETGDDPVLAGQLVTMQEAYTAKMLAA